MPGGLTQFTKRFNQIKALLGIASSPWSPASLRGGGAEKYARSTQNSNITYSGRADGQILGPGSITSRLRLERKATPVSRLV
eukprot:1570893-Amphidinium_carterae.2